MTRTDFATLCYEGDCAKMTGRARPCPVHDAQPPLPTRAAQYPGECTVHQKARDDLATERAAREQAEKHREEDLASFIRTNQACVLERDAEEERADQAERERDTALARVKEAEDANANCLRMTETANASCALWHDRALAAETALASARELLAQALMVLVHWNNYQSEEGRSYIPEDENAAVLLRIESWLTSHPAPVAAPERGTRDVVETAIDRTKDDKHSRWNALMARTAELPVTVMATSEYPSPAPCPGCAAARELLLLWYHNRAETESGELIEVATQNWLNEHGEICAGCGATL